MIHAWTAVGLDIDRVTVRSDDDIDDDEIRIIGFVRLTRAA